ncbi:probable mannitol dehydrogenase [Actinidia eriantha]|uniref:probable mannitol dehydrogenase n=1 Tax=Actinidia eriantha TaxID=165200 RepID=UPI00258E7836|nr:probable mannitol dehydrogenase [Actinidia eriantha]
MAGSQEQEQTQKAFGWAARDSSGLLSSFQFTRRANGDNDITMKILYCGICHSDLHTTTNEFGFSSYPMVPGHEIVGVVTQVGCKVNKFKVGDKAAVGCFIGSCGTCSSCKDDLENYCPKASTTYTFFEGQPKTYGGFSDIFVVNEHFAIQFPDSLSLEGGAPLLCAGITVYSPMKYFGLSEAGKHLGVVGLGGLGHLAVKFAKAFGMKVTVISTSPNKKHEAIERLGADSFLVSSDTKEMQAAKGTMDGIIDTVSAPHPLNPLVDLLRSQGKLILLGAPDVERPPELSIFPLIVGRKLIAGSAAGGIKETQEMIDFAGKHNITADVEVIPMDYVNTAMKRLAMGNIRYRFVIDIGNTLRA